MIEEFAFAIAMLLFGAYGIVLGLKYAGIAVMVVACLIMVGIGIEAYTGGSTANDE